MQPLAEGLFGGLQIKLTARAGVVGEYRCACKTEQMVFLEFLYDSCVHLAKLAAVAFIENQHHMLAINRMCTVLGYEHRQLLYGGDNDVRIVILQLFFQYCHAGIAVGSTFLKSVVFLHGLVVQVLAVYHKQYLIDTFHLAGQTGRLK